MTRAILLFVCAASVGSAQTRASSFEIAVIKPSNIGSNAISGLMGIGTGGRIDVRNVSLIDLIQLAYDVERFRVTGGPGWLATSRYSVQARPAAPVDRAQARLMLQSLLADRFALRLHTSRVAVNGYTLRAEAGDSKLKKSTTEDEGFAIMSQEEIRGPGTMVFLARALKASMGAPVEDQTGLTGKYDIALKWNDKPEVEFGLSLFSALKQQLGLTLKPEKVTIEVLVVDSANRQPAEN